MVIAGIKNGFVAPETHMGVQMSSKGQGMTYLNNHETWEDFDREREERFITLLGGDDDARAFWAWLDRRLKDKKPLDYKCPGCGSYLGQYHSPECKRRER